MSIDDVMKIACTFGPDSLRAAIEQHVAEAERAWRDAEIERLRIGLRIAISAADGWYDDPRGRPCPSISDDVRKLAATEGQP